VTPVNRWKLISLVLAGCMSYSWWFGDARSHSPRPASHAKLKGPLGKKAAVLGMSSEQVVHEMFGTKDVDDLIDLAERLGTIGNDDAIDAVMPLLQDPRTGVPEAIVRAFGAIATEHAVDVLIKTAADPREGVRVAAVGALGATRNRRAEPTLIAIAQQYGDAAQSVAIDALAETGSEQAIELLATIAGHPTETANNAIRALGRIEAPAAKAALIALVDSPNLTVAGMAIGELKDIDEAMVNKLAAIVAEGDRELVPIALGTLARAGEAGLPVLRAAALEGPTETRISAVSAMSEIDNPAVLETLRTILDNEEGRLADTAASVLASINSDEARETLISAALSDQAGTTRAIEYLMRQTGPEVEQALLVVAKSDSSSRWSAVEHLVRSGNADALQLAVAQARGGSDEAVKLAAMEALADGGTQPAIEALIEVVRASGDLKPRALAILGESRPDDPVVAKMLHDSVQSSDPAEAAAAASALAKVGTTEARDALLAALHSSDADVARNAASSLARFRLTDEVTAAMRSAVVAHPELKAQVMQQMVASGSSFGLELAKQALSGEVHEAYRAMSALESAGTPAAFDVLAASARAATDPQIRSEIISSIGNTGDKRATDVLAQALRDSELGVRSTAARSLGNMGTTQARDLLVNLSRSGNLADRQVAASTLRRFDDPNTTRRLTELIRDPDPTVAYAAIDAVVDRPDAVAAVRSLLHDANVPRSTRRDAAQALSYRGISDPAIEDLLANYDGN
jgi:HEAT repeat protein